MIKINKRFLLMVGLPMLLSSVYFIGIASPEYKSTSVIIITNPSKESGGISSFLSGGSGDSTTGAYLLKSFIPSWEEYKNINAKMNVADLYSKGDFFSSFGGLRDFYQDNDVTQFNHLNNNINVNIDKKSSIVTLDTYAYTSKQAYDLQKKIIQDSVEHINEMNRQQDIDFTKTAENNVSKFRKAIIADDQALADFRMKTGYYDPDIDYNNFLQKSSGLFQKKIELQAQYKSIISDTPNNPVANQYKEQMNVFDGNLSNLNKESHNLKDVARQYNYLVSQRNMDEKLLNQASQTLSQESIKASQDHYYLNIISSPSQPHTAEYPNKIINLGIIFAVCLLIWALSL